MRAILSFFLIVILVNVEAQSYGLATGLRLGNDPVGRSLGLTSQYRLAKHTTIEGILETDFSTDHLLHVLLQEHQPFLSRRLNIYIGLGGSIGQERSVVVQDDGLLRIVDDETIGVDLMAGIEVTLISYTISLDVRPNFNMVGREEWIENQVGISVRHVIVSGAKQNKKKRKRRKAKKKKEREENREDREPLFGDWFNDLFKKK